MHTRPVFWEWDGFADKLYRIATENEYAALQNELEKNPERGDRVQALGGAGKIRMSIKGRGKSGGARVVYYVRSSAEIWFIDIYAKADKKDLSAAEKKRIAKIVSILKGG